MITDHLPNFLIIKNLCLKLQIKEIRIRGMKNFNQEKYIQDIKELDALNFHLHKDVNTNFNDFQNKLIEIIENNAPYITLPKNREALYYKKFMKTKNKF